MYNCAVCEYTVIGILCDLWIPTTKLDHADMYNCVICEHAVIDIAYNFDILATTL